MESAVRAEEFRRGKSAILSNPTGNEKIAVGQENRARVASSSRHLAKDLCPTVRGWNRAGALHEKPGDAHKQQREIKRSLEHMLCLSDFQK